MPITAAEYAKSGKVDQSTSIGILLATAHAAEAWSKLPEDQKSADTARRLVEEAPMRPDNNFLEAAGTRELARNYAENLMDRSAALDEKEGKAKGTHLIAYMNEAADAIKDVDIEKAKSGGVPMSKLNEVRSKFSKASEQHLETKGTYLDDFMETLKKDPKIGKDAEGKDIAIEPKEMGGGFLQLLVKLIGMFLGIDLGGMFASPDQTREQKADAQNVALVSSGTEEKLDKLINAANGLRDGKDIDKNAEIVVATAKELGGKGDDKERGPLDADAAKKLGEQVLDDVARVRSGLIKPEALGDGALKSLASAQDKNAPIQEVPEFLQSLAGDALKVVKTLAAGVSYVVADVSGNSAPKSTGAVASTGKLER
jgi:hypothetical protein